MGNAWSRNLCEHKRPLSVRTYDDLRCCLARRPRACAGAKAEGQPGRECGARAGNTPPTSEAAQSHPVWLWHKRLSNTVVVAQETFQHSGKKARRSNLPKPIRVKPTHGRSSLKLYTELFGAALRFRRSFTSFFRLGTTFSKQRLSTKMKLLVLYLCMNIGSVLDYNQYRNVQVDKL